MDDYINPFLAYVGVPAALLAAFRATQELRYGNREKMRENRLEQAAAAKDSLPSLFSDEKALAALRMLDWSGREFVDGADRHIVNWGDLGDALRTEVSRAFDTKQTFIRDSFEKLFDHLQLVAHYVAIGYLNFDDVAVPIAYYARKITAHMDKYGPFLDEYGYATVRAFLVKAASQG